MTKKRKYSALYRYIESLQGDGPWGSVLDAGTGVNSIRWLSELSTERWTAVTGSRGEARLVHEALGTSLRPEDRVALGNWADKKFLKGEVYDTVFADYLLGAVEGFSPYFQPYLFYRLRLLTGKVLYVTGLEPYVPMVEPETRAGRLIWELGRFRDACVLIKGGMPYREYPLPWVVDQLRLSGFSVRTTKHFNIRYKELFVNAQINIAVNGLEKLTDQALAQALNCRADGLRTQALEIISEEGALDTCRSYVIKAEPV
jgi:hypothetical protein